VYAARFSALGLRAVSGMCPIVTVSELPRRRRSGRVRRSVPARERQPGH
jgi:hypothetical protein